MQYDIRLDIEDAYQNMVLEIEQIKKEEGLLFSHRSGLNFFFFIVFELF